MESQVLPPETLEGWFALHQVFLADRAAINPWLQKCGADATNQLEGAWQAVAVPSAGGWSAAAQLIGSTADIMLMHFRPTLEAIGDVQRCVARLSIMDVLKPALSFLSVTEAGMYHLTAQLSREAAERGDSVGGAAYRTELARRLDVERESAHVQRRLYPELPAGLPYVCFYPMSKRRNADQNWYTLALDERSRLMRSHGETGRRYAGSVTQIITGAIGFEAWEWGVTLFAKDPLDFKKLVTDMRFDEVSAKYADFGDFYVGKLAGPRHWLDELAQG